MQQLSHPIEKNNKKCEDSERKKWLPFYTGFTTVLNLYIKTELKKFKSFIIFRQKTKKTTRVLDIWLFSAEMVNMSSAFTSDATVHLLLTKVCKQRTKNAILFLNLR